MIYRYFDQIERMRRQRPCSIGWGPTLAEKSAATQ
jgi:hypothetical protein